MNKRNEIEEKLCSDCKAMQHRNGLGLNCATCYRKALVNPILKTNKNTMNFKEYQELAERTRNRKLSHTMEMGNYALGLPCEAGEVGDIMKKHIYHDHTLNIEELIKEMGDTLWYMANLCTLLNIDFDRVAEENIKKLKNRYPDGFSKECSVNRKE